MANVIVSLVLALLLEINLATVAIGKLETFWCSKDKCNVHGNYQFCDTVNARCMNCDDGKDACDSKPPIECITYCHVVKKEQARLRGTECPNLPAIINGSHNGTTTGTTRQGTIVESRCDTGYQLQGAMFTVCVQHGHWSSELPMCKEITCPPPPQIMNGRVFPRKPSYRPGTSVVYSCNNDYRLLYDRSERTCQDNGTWDSEFIPVCMPIDHESVRVVAANDEHLPIRSMQIFTVVMITVLVLQGVVILVALWYRQRRCRNTSNEKSNMSNVAYKGIDQESLPETEHGGYAVKTKDFSINECEGNNPPTKAVESQKCQSTHMFQPASPVKKPLLQINKSNASRVLGDGNESSFSANRQKGPSALKWDKLETPCNILVDHIYRLQRQNSNDDSGNEDSSETQVLVNHAQCHGEYNRNKDSCIGEVNSSSSSGLGSGTFSEDERANQQSSESQGRHTEVNFVVDVQTISKNVTGTIISNSSNYNNNRSNSNRDSKNKSSGPSTTNVSESKEPEPAKADERTDDPQTGPSGDGEGANKQEGPSGKSCDAVPLVDCHPKEIVNVCDADGGTRNTVDEGDRQLRSSVIASPSDECPGQLVKIAVNTREINADELCW